ncbi:MAG: DAK2 domain-containing protein, partial [Reyranella sp.]|nr:DAK2 domain-containing protein [Reyranella sp.]
QGAAATAHMRPRLGRAAYLGDRVLGTPDAGAEAAVVWLAAIDAA